VQGAGLKVCGLKFRAEASRLCGFVLRASPFGCRVYDSGLGLKCTGEGL
jgi:hypothetical protein